MKQAERGGKVFWKFYGYIFTI